MPHDSFVGHQHDAVHPPKRGGVDASIFRHEFGGSVGAPACPFNAPDPVALPPHEVVSSVEFRRFDAKSAGSHFDEIVVLIDGRDALAQLGRRSERAWIGMRPDVIDESRSWIPDEEGHDAFVARCDCGELGCGALVARIQSRNGLVTWTDFRDGSDTSRDDAPIDHPGYAFDRDDYLAALAGTKPQSDWSPVTRHAAEQVNQRASEMIDQGRDLRIGTGRLRWAGCLAHGDECLSATVWVGHRGDEGYGPATAWYVLKDGETSDELAARVLAQVTDGSILANPTLRQRSIDAEK